MTMCLPSQHNPKTRAFECSYSSQVRDTGDFRHRFRVRFPLLSIVLPTPIPWRPPQVLDNGITDIWEGLLFRSALGPASG